MSKVSILRQKKSFNEEINKHIVNNFNYPEEAYSKNIQGRVLVQFVIDKFGEISDFNFRTPYQGELLEKETKRIIKKLPKFIPGRHHGKTVKVKYGIPISFNIPGVNPANVKKPLKNTEFEELYTFTTVDKLPAFKNCAKSNDVSENCFEESFANHINKNLLYPEEALEKNIQGKVIAYFVIDSEGEIANIKIRVSKGKEIFGKATLELIEKLPKFIPGRHKGKVTNVRHAFPVIFQLEDET